MNDQKILLVTGGSRGIGAATALAAAREGYAVAVNYVNDANAAARVVNGITSAGGKAIALKADVAREDEIAKLFQEVAKNFGGLTHLVNNAGIIGRASSLTAADPAMIREVIDLNVTGAILVAREAVKHISTANGGKGGAIVNVSSMAAALGAAGEYTWYAASKGAIDSFTIGLAREVVKDGIRVNAVSPGLIETDIHASGGQPDRLERLAHLTPLGRAGTADEVAAAIMWLLSDKASYVTGTNIRVSGGR
jgi:NAD(P)-dependent dehydrogenase (short-subunit alcohol dehydrogenase family)